MDTKVKITIITVAALLLIIIGTSIHQTLRPQKTGVLDKFESDTVKRQSQSEHKDVIRANVPIRNSRYFFPNRDKPKVKVDPTAMDEKVELAGEQDRGMPDEFAPDTGPEMKNVDELKLWDELSGENKAK
ncbi:MAG: hypothetical protein V1739_00825 [Candidatus Omnitrophota bacterium]